MRKISFLLLLAMLLPLVSCSTAIETPRDTEQGSTAENSTKVTAEYPFVSDKLSLEAIDSFAVADDAMKEDELRRLCVEFFAYCQSFAWTPSEAYTFSLRGKDVTLEEGVVYAGLPYVTGGKGNIYRLLDYYDEQTGVVDVKRAGANPEDFGNQCSFGSFWAWARLVNSASFGGTSTMVAKNGFIPVGSYRYDLTISKFGEVTTDEICRENGEEVMYASYAKMKPADGLVNSVSAGHVMMCASEPVVVYKDDGTISGEESYFTYIHQASVWSEGTQSDGSPLRAQTIPYSKKTFAETYKENYLPFTFAELIGEDPVEKSETDFTHKKETVTVEEMKVASIHSNYAISAAYLTLYDESGTPLWKKSVHAEKIDQKELCLGTALFSAELNKLAEKNHTLTVKLRLGTGETPTVYTGTLVPQ